MPYDDRIPLALQLLRISGETTYDTDSAVVLYHLAPWGDTGNDVPRFCISDPDADMASMDVHSAIEDTLHLILDHGGTPDDVRQILGLAPESELDAQALMSGECFLVGHDYGYDGRLLGDASMLPPEACDLSAVLSPQQYDNIRDASRNVPPQRFLPAAKALASAEFTSWQAYEVCKAHQKDFGDDALSAIANPKLNHAQMRELIRAAERFGSSSPEFQTLASHPDFPAEKLHDLRQLMGWAGYRDIGFDPEWLNLDSDSLFELTYAIVADVPADALALYCNGAYPAENMAVITFALTEGMDRPQIDRLLNPEYAPEQLMCIESAITDGMGTAQLDLLCDAALPAPIMEAVRRGFAQGVSCDFMEGCIESRFSPRQMAVLFDAAVSEGVTPEVLGMMADPKLSPRQMLSLQIGFEYGRDAAQVGKEKQAMLRTKGLADDGSGKETARPSALRDAARESRAASGQLVGDREEHDDRHEELG